jgi:hypothetical protein
MAKKTALEKIEYHEKKWIIGGLSAILLAVLSGHIS